MSKRSKRPGEREREDLNRAPIGHKDGARPSKLRMPSQAAFRELIESVVIAFVLAFLFRTFEAEAFVIPTGSMATTLMGRHKDVSCPMCGYPYQVGASEEVDQVTGALLANKEVIGGTCPMCRYTDSRLGREPSFNGDRILVSKFAYEFQQPHRWDVAVFRFPAEAKTNYIKRIAGLPGETIRLYHGDLFVKKRGQTTFEIARKPPSKLRAMLQMVHDNDYGLPEPLRSKGWPERWQPTEATGGWKSSEGHKVFSANGGSTAPTWLRYRHLVPSQRVWEAIDRDALKSDYRPRPQLISDFCAYNTTLERGSSLYDAQGLGLHWVGDLAVECAMHVRAATGAAVFELVEGGHLFQCRIDLASGEATLSIPGDSMACTGDTGIRGPGAHKILFANVDDQLRLWVDGRLVKFNAPTTYSLDNHEPQQADLSPVGIASVGANVEIARLKVFRDIYYIADRTTHASDRTAARAPEPISDFDDPFGPFGSSRQTSVAEVLSNPAAYSSAQMQSEEFELADDQFLVLGDNSPRSKDSRLWGSEYYVARDLLIGKALFIYWPHSWDEITIGNTEIPFPFFPNFRRMHFVR